MRILKKNEFSNQKMFRFLGNRMFFFSTAFHKNMFKTEIL